MRLHRFSFFVSLFWFFCFNFNCGDGASTRQVIETDAASLECGPGTVEINGVCVLDGNPAPIIYCDEGTTLIGAGCVPLPYDNPEICDEIDNDNDGVTDEGCPVPDFDEDNDGFTPFDGDCNDDDFNINPLAVEYCNGVDDNCDGQTDESDPIAGQDCFALLDFVPVPGVLTCILGDIRCPPIDLEECHAREELCGVVGHGIDDNCDGQVDEGCGAVCGNGICEAGEADVCVDCFSTQTDVDSDGYSPPEDCDDFNFFTHPGADEFCDGKDNDCDGLTDEGYPTQRFLRDADGDGHGDPESYVEAADCLSPLEGYINWIEGYDNDCDDNFALTYPGAEEICDGDDNNCDGQIDEGCCGNGICNSTEDVFTCQVDCPAEEECDGVDNDNDHAIDDGCPCVDPSETIWDRHCGHAMPAGEFFYGWQTCENGIWTECRYGDSIGEQSCEWHCQNDGDGDGLVCCFDPDCADLPQCQEPLDLCNGVDEDGDGETDENDPSVGSLCVAINTIPDEEGIVSYVPVNGRWECSHDVMNYRCSPDPALCYAEDYCDNWIDDDCDGIVDEGCGADEPPHYCEPVYTAYGTIIGWRGCCGDSFLTTTHPEAGMLIKGTFSNVYYYASDGNRYVFATNVELESWYSPLDEYGIPASPNGELCQQVYEFPDEVLASIPLALTGNVTLRPGAFITGEETSSARYVVDHCATLREVDPITALDEIYASTEGSTAWERTVVLWSLMWSNYEIGQPVTSAADFDWLTIYSESQIEVELGISGTLCQ